MNAAIPTKDLQMVLKSQYHAALAMLRQAIEHCPDDLWFDPRPTNPFWKFAYHTLYFTHLYLQPDESAFRFWEHHRGSRDLDETSGGPYTKSEVLAYCARCEEMLDAAVDALDLASPESGFSWYRVSKLEHQFINIRHIQHHAAQLADRLRSAIDFGVDWVGAKRDG